jgi:membrane-bound ClpP family serine protease
MAKEIVNYINKKVKRLKQEKVIDLDTPEGRAQASEDIIARFEAMFPGRVERKDK